MHAKLEHKNLSNALKIAGYAVAKRSTIPVLKHYHVSADAEHRTVTIRATDLAVSIITSIPCADDSEVQGGAITVPADTLAKFVSTLSGGEIELEDNHSLVSLSVKSGKAKANIKGIDAQEFPVIAAESLACVHTIPAAELLRVIGEVVYAAEKSDARPVLQAICFTVKGDTLTLAATDGFRLAVSNGKLAEAAAKDFVALIPTPAIAHLQSILKGGVVGFVLCGKAGEETQIKFECGDTSLVAQLAEGTFPDFKKIIPKKIAEGKISASVSANDLLRACQQVSVFAKDNAMTARFSFHAPTTTDPAMIGVYGQAEESGDGVSEIDCEACDGDIDISLNLQFLSDVLRVLSGGKSVIAMTVPTSPVLITPGGRDDFLYVLMPMRIGK